MRILFVSSGNSFSGISPIVYNQGESLKSIGHDVEYFTIKGKGIRGYLSNIFTLRRYLKKNNFDIVHAHYSLSAMVASLAGAFGIVVSLMGSDVNGSGKTKTLLRFFHRFFWRSCIVKTKEMSDKLGFSSLEIVPNGVDISKFFPIDSTLAKKQLNWDVDHFHILFAANPDRYEKNFTLAKQSFDSLNQEKAELHTFSNTPHDDINIWLNAADLVILSSLWEGSPNVIKEAMACNKIILSTEVGDIKWLFGDQQGFFISSSSLEDYSSNLSLAINYSNSFKNSNGRKRIMDLQLDSKTIAERLTHIYLNSLIK